MNKFKTSESSFFLTLDFIYYIAVTFFGVFNVFLVIDTYTRWYVFWFLVLLFVIHFLIKGFNFFRKKPRQIFKEVFLKDTGFVSSCAFWVGGIYTMLIKLYNFGWFYSSFFAVLALLMLYRKILTNNQKFSSIFVGILLGVLFALGIIAYV